MGVSYKPRGIQNNDYLTVAIQLDGNFLRGNGDSSRQ
jgi:hypothetical protein